MKAFSSDSVCFLALRQLRGLVNAEYMERCHGYGKLKQADKYITQWINQHMVRKVQLAFCAMISL